MKQNVVIRIAFNIKISSGLLLFIIALGIIYLVQVHSLTESEKTVSVNHRISLRLQCVPWPGLVSTTYTVTIHEDGWMG